MEDAVYNRFKKELSNYHKRGYYMDFPSSEASYNESGKENVVYIQLAMIKKGKNET